MIQLLEGFLNCLQKYQFQHALYVHKKCHSRFCPSCGVKVQRLHAARVKTFCPDVEHRHFVFTIPESYRVWFRRDRSALNLLYVAARNTLCKVLNESIYRKEKTAEKR